MTEKDQIEEQEEDELGKATVVGGTQARANAADEMQWTKYGTKTGHGFAAEDANALSEKLKGANVDKVGTSNELNGADRISNGIQIQSKYCKTPERSLNDAFDKTTGKYRYYTDSNKTSPQVLEVPKDQYDKVLKGMEQKIKEGKVDGVTDPAKAKELVKVGVLTYQQAKNIAKAGNIDSIKFDVANQSVVATCTLGVSFIVVYASSLWNGADQKVALKNAIYQSGKSGLLSLGAGVGTQQVLKTKFARGVNKQLVNSIYKSKFGQKIAKDLAKKCLNQNIKGKVSKKVISKLLTSNIISEAISGVVTVGPDLYRASISKSISWQQFAKNFSVFSAGLSGAVAGAELGAKASLAVPDPLKPVVIIGTPMVTSTMASIATKKILDQISEDDAQIMVEAMNERVAELAAAYCLTEEEFENLVIPKIKEITDQKWFVKMYQYGGRENTQKLYEFVDKEMLSTFEDAFKQKKHVSISKRLKVFFFTIKTKKIDGIAVPYVSNLKQMLLFFLGLVSVAVLVVLLLFLLRSCQSCSMQSREKDNLVQENTLNDNLFAPRKSPYFLRDSSEFEDYHQALEWFDKTAIEIKECLAKNPNICFEIKGYIAGFDNDIDGMILSNDRAKVVKSGLVERGIPEDILQVIVPNDDNEYTNYFSKTDRHENRVVVISLMKK